MRWRRTVKPSRTELIDKKHRLEGEIRALAAETGRLQVRGADAVVHEARLARLRSEHHQTRLAIDRTSPE